MCRGRGRQAAVFGNLPARSSGARRSGANPVAGQSVILRPMGEAQDLKKVGLKATLPRLRILEILENSRVKHLSAEDVYKALLDAGEEVGLATVYRVLTQFEAAGLVMRHNFDSGHSVFELNRGPHHDHMVCLKTGKVIEFENDEIERLQRKIADEHGYVLQDHSLVLYVKPKDK
jgi:Fur family ferric uptake transcriptional regulator